MDISYFEIALFPCVSPSSYLELSVSFLLFFL